MMIAFKSILGNLINLVFPQICAGCGAHNTPLCDACIERAHGGRTPEQSFITSCFDYQNQAIRRVIWQFKYKNVRNVAKCFGEKMYETMIGDLGDSLYVSKKERYLLVPVPLHKKRLRERGYNQSELLTREIIKYDSEKMFVLEPKALIRTRATNAQARKEKRAARFENLRGAFIADATLVYRKNIILVDDVATTGATLSEARKTLLKAGARSVKAWTIAH